MWFLGEKLITNFTHVWSLSWMDSNVDFELTGCCPFLITHFTCMFHPTRLFISLFCLCVWCLGVSLCWHQCLHVGCLTFCFQDYSWRWCRDGSCAYGLKIMCVLLAGTISTYDNTKIHHYLFLQILQYQNGILKKHMPAPVYPYLCYLVNLIWTSTS